MRLPLNALALAALLLAGLASPAKPQGLVEGNSLAVTAPDGIHILDPLGELVRFIEFVGKVEPCWLPNGNLLVADGFGTLVEIHPSVPGGAIVREIDIGDIVTGMTMGAGGLIYVTTPTSLVVLDLAEEEDEEIVEVIELAGGGVNPCWLPNGHILVAVRAPIGSEGGFEGLREVDPATGATIREIPVPGITGFDVHPVSGNFFVTTESDIREIDAASGELVDVIEIAGGGVQPFWLPNGHLGVVELATGAIREVDVEAGEVVGSLAEGVAATGFAVAPFHLPAVMSGQLAEAGMDGLAADDLAGALLYGPAITEVEEKATLIVEVATGMFALVLDEAGIIAPMFDTGIVALAGLDIPINAERALSGFQVPPANSTKPFAAFAGTARGEHGANGYYFPEEVEDAITLAGPGVVFHGKLEAKLGGF